MARCISCYAVIAKADKSCYVCGDTIPKLARFVPQPRPVSTTTNAVFLLSLAFTAYCFLGKYKLPLPAILAISSALLLVRILAEKIARKHPR